MAKNACVFAAAIGACFNCVPAMDNVLMLLDSDRPDLAKVLVGMYHVTLDPEPRTPNLAKVLVGMFHAEL